MNLPHNYMVMKCMKYTVKLHSFGCCAPSAGATGRKAGSVNLIRLAQLSPATQFT